MYHIHTNTNTPIHNSKHTKRQIIFKSQIDTLKPISFKKHDSSKIHYIYIRSYCINHYAVNTKRAIDLTNLKPKMMKFILYCDSMCAQ